MSGTQTTFTDGEAYERLMGRWSGLVGRQFLEWLAVPPGMNWLDAGCGNGAFTEEIATHAAPAAIIGIDPAESQIAYAIKRPGAKPAKFQLGDAQALPFANDSFDAAVTALVIAFIPDPAKAVAELSRVVRPGGWVASYMWDLPGGGLPLQPMYAAMRKMGLSPPLPPSFEFSRREAMQELVDQGRAGASRDYGDFHSGRLLQFRRFLGILQHPGRSSGKTAANDGA